MAETTLMLTMPARRRPVLTAVVERSPLLHLGDVSTLRRSTLDRALPVGDHEVELVGVGPAGLGTEVFIVDEDGECLDRDLVCGEVVTRTTSLAAGYLRSDGTVDAFDPEGFRTGDIGFLDDGELYVIDRLKNVIIRSGQNISATAIEDLVAEVTGLPADTIVVIDSDLTEGDGRITALVEMGRAVDTDAVSEAMVANADRFRPAVDDLVLLRPNALPRTTSGKKQHRKARLLLEAGELRIVSQTALTPERHPEAVAEVETETIDLTRLEVAAVIEGLVSAIAGRRSPMVEVTEASMLTSDLGLESVDLYELAVSIEDELDIALHESDLREVRAVGDLIEIGTARRRDGAASAGTGITTALEEAATPFPQLLRTVDDQKDRQVCIGGRWLTDFASCNYLGLDLHNEVIEAIDPALRQWGVHPSWTRAVASPAPYRELEVALAGLVGVPDTVVFPALSLLHLSALPALATPTGSIFIDRAAHQSLQQAAELASGRGATVKAFDHGDLAELDHLLADAANGPRVLVVDGVYSMSGGPAPLVDLAGLAARHDALIYVDDAHGFGILGENPTEQSPYGHRGNGVVKHFGLDYERIVYCATLSKAYSSMGAFVTVQTPAERRQLERSGTLVFSGPIPTASLASALAGLEVNDDSGDVIRARLRRLAGRLGQGIRELGFDYDNAYDFPIVNITIGSITRAREASTILWDHGLLVTPSIYPAVPLDACGVRFTLTAANTDLEIDQALTALAEIAARVNADQPSSSATIA
jgi:acyl carrier protein